MPAHTAALGSWRVLTVDASNFRSCLLRSNVALLTSKRSFCMPALSFPPLDRILHETGAPSLHPLPSSSSLESPFSSSLCSSPISTAFSDGHEEEGVRAAGQRCEPHLHCCGLTDARGEVETGRALADDQKEAHGSIHVDADRHTGIRQLHVRRSVENGRSRAHHRGRCQG